MRRSEISLALLAAFIAAGCGRRQPERSAEVPQKVLVRKARRVEAPLFIRASGTVEAKETAHTAFLVPGLVRRVHAQEGQVVRAGQLLAELDAKDYESRVQAAASQVGAAQAGVGKAQSAVRKQELEQARADFERAEEEYKRYKALYERQSMTPNDFRKVETAYIASRERYSLAREGARTEDRAAAEAALRGAAAQQEIARKSLADTRLLAPFGGVIAKRDVDPGDMAAAGRPVFVLMALNPVKVRAGVPEADVGRVRTGQRASVRVPSLGAAEFEARVETVGVAADPAARTFAVRLTVPNPKLELRAGMIAEARIQTGATIQVLTVPAQAIVRDPQGATLIFVYYPDKKRVYSRRVDPGAFYGTEVEIARGLNDGETIVVGGQRDLIDGRLAEAEDERP